MSRTPHGSPSPLDPAPSKSNRRQFLIGAAGGAALARPVAAMAWGAQRPANSAPDWDQLGRTLKGNLLRPGDAGYDDVIKIRNLRYAATQPAGVALVADAQDVATAIAWARDNRVPMVSRSGGHSYAGYSTTPGLVINLKAMTGVTVDRTNGNMKITGAATNQDVADAGKPAGRAIPGGQCPAVGVAGFVLGGGLGLLHAPARVGDRLTARHRDRHRRRHRATRHGRRNSRKRSCSGPYAAGVAATSGSTPHLHSARSSSRSG